MCNLYAQTKPQDAMLRAFGSIADDGALIGGASLKSEDFLAIYRAYEALTA